MKEDFGSAVKEAVRVWFEGNYPSELSTVNESETKYTKDYFDSVESDYGKEKKVSDVITE